MQISTSHSSRPGAGGYLLLEVVVALGVASMVLYGVFAIADGSLKLANSVSEEGKDVITHEAFFTFMGRNFEELPGNAVMDLTFEDGGAHWLSNLTFQNVPTAFSWAGQTLSPEAVQLSTVPRRHGNLDIVLRYYDVPILDDSDSTADVNAEPVAEIVLLRDVFWFEWYAIDGNNPQEPIDTWDIRGRLPLQMKLDVKFSASGERIVHHFWIPPKANPETIVGSQRRGAPNMGPGGQQDSDRPSDDDPRFQPDGPNNNSNGGGVRGGNQGGNRNQGGSRGGGGRGNRGGGAPDVGRGSSGAPPIPGR